MKLNITLDLEDAFWNDDFTLSEAISDNIKRGIIAEISNDIRKNVKETIEARCREYIDTKFISMVDAYFKDFIQNNKISMSGNKGEKLMKDWIMDYFQEKVKGYCYGGFDQTMKRVAEDFTKNLKQAYDMKFASMIVKNMAEQNLLRDKELAKLIEPK